MTARERYPRLAVYKPAVTGNFDRQLQDALDEIDRLTEEVDALRSTLTQIARSLPRVHAPDGVIIRAVDQGWVLITPTAKEPV